MCAKPTDFWHKIVSYSTYITSLAQIVIRRSFFPKKKIFFPKNWPNFGLIHEARTFLAWWVTRTPLYPTYRGLYIWTTALFWGQNGRQLSGRHPFFRKKKLDDTEIKHCWTTATQNPVVQIYSPPVVQSFPYIRTKKPVLIYGRDCTVFLKCHLHFAFILVPPIDG